MLISDLIYLQLDEKLSESLSSSNGFKWMSLVIAASVELNVLSVPAEINTSKYNNSVIFIIITFGSA